jgi:hypothetical protein
MYFVAQGVKGTLHLFPLFIAVIKLRELDRLTENHGDTSGAYPLARR